VRSDGRAADALRPIRLTPDYTENPLASVLCEFGRTRVLCTVCEEVGVPRFLQGAGRGWVTAEYAMLPGATDTRSQRESARGRPSGRSQEIQRLIGRSLRGVTDLGALGDRTLWVDCDVLQADGGTRCASITGAYTALALATRRLLRRGDVERDPLRDSLAAVAGGIVGGEVVLALPYAEASTAPGRGRFIEVQGTAEQGTFDADELAAMTRLALDGIRRLGELQRAAIEAASP